MVTIMMDWNGKEIKTARSKGGKISVCNYEDNLVIPPDSLWPNPDIVKKLYRSGHSKNFDEPMLSALSEKLGFYCDLQSLRSEDAITWSVFGTLQYFPKKFTVQFVNSLLGRIGEELRVNVCSIQLWTRIAHPDNLVAGGPELDFQIVGDNIVIFGESKWTSKITGGQGKKRNKDQLQLRREFLQKFGNKIFHRASKLLVLVVGLEECQNKYCPHITWEEICGKTQHPLENEIKRYYLWKEQYGR